MRIAILGNDVRLELIAIIARGSSCAEHFVHALHADRQHVLDPQRAQSVVIHPMLEVQSRLDQIYNSPDRVRRVRFTEDKIRAVGAEVVDIGHERNSLPQVRELDPPVLQPVAALLRSLHQLHLKILSLLGALELLRRLLRPPERFLGHQWTNGFQPLLQSRAQLRNREGREQTLKLVKRRVLSSQQLESEQRMSVVLVRMLQGPLDHNFPYLF
mmetsp:Transcript_35240/g.110099  ORF Transcript_35240/g.110099 Transcript_35240/m.110099 type:complete len:214 (-) Transcript_35240:126-767(-)